MIRWLRIAIVPLVAAAATHLSTGTAEEIATKQISASRAVSRLIPVQYRRQYDPERDAPEDDPQCKHYCDVNYEGCVKPVPGSKFSEKDVREYCQDQLGRCRRACRN